MPCAPPLAWKYALGLELPDRGVDFSLLSGLRAGNAEDRLFATLLDALQDRGLLKASGQQRSDSTHGVAAMRTTSSRAT